MKIARLALILVLSATALQAQDDSLEWTARWRNGQFWKNMPSDFKGAYVMGLGEAIGNMAPAWGSQIDRCRCSTADIVAGIDSVYSRDTAYLKLPIMTAMSLFLGHATGDEWEKVDRSAQNWLRVLANDDNSEAMIPTSIGGKAPVPCPPDSSKKTTSKKH